MSAEMDAAVKELKDLREAIQKGNSDKEALEKALKDTREKLDKAQSLGARQSDYPDEDEGGEQVSRNGAGKLGSQAILFRKDAGLDEFKKWADDCLVLSRMLKVPVKELRHYRRFAKAEFAKAAQSTSAGSGGEWIPTIFSDKLISLMHLDFKVDALFPYVDMPSATYTLPAMSSDIVAYKLGESTTADPSKITTSSFGTTNRTLTAIKLGVRVPFSEEIDEDSVIPMLDQIKNDIAVAMAEGIEQAHITGDTATPHMDVNVTAGSGDRRTSWIGLRKHAITAAVSQSLATFNLTNLTAIRTGMGKYGVDPRKLAWIVGPKGYSNFLGLTEVRTLEKLGDRATLLTGQLAELDGIPVIVTETMPENLNATGTYDGTSVLTKSVVLLVYRPGFVVGRRRALTIKTLDLPESDQTVLMATCRRVLQATYDTATYDTIGYGYNF